MADLNTLIQQRDSLDSQIRLAQNEMRAINIGKIKAIMAEGGITLVDLSEKPKGAKVPVKYRDAQGNTWTGRGKKPAWLANALANGITLEQFAIK